MSGDLAFDAAWIFAVFLVVVVLLAIGVTLRRYLLERGGGTVECAMRLPGGPWRLGVAAISRISVLVPGVRLPAPAEQGVQPPDADRAVPAGHRAGRGGQPG